MTILIPMLAVGLFVFLSTRESANCFDNKQNQDERGVDCGGVCVAVCQNEARDIALLWTRYINVADDVYSVVAMIENPNTSLESHDAPYIFRLYDEKGILIYERKGSAFIPSGTTFPIFEHALRTGERVPARATFEFMSSPYWEAQAGDKIFIRTISKVLDKDATFPKLVSVQKNTSLIDLTDISFVALLYDENENLISASKTVIDRLPRETSETLVFTWPNAFNTVVAKIEIVPVAYTVN